MFYARRIPDPDKSPPSRWKLSKYIVSTDSNERINRCGPVGSGGHGVPANEMSKEQARSARIVLWPLSNSAVCRGLQEASLPAFSVASPSVWPRLLNHILNSLLF